MSIIVSEKHGVNPSVQICFYCKKPIGVALFGKLHGTKVKEMFGEDFAKDHLRHNDPRDTEAPREVVLDLEPCEGCTVFEPHSKLGCFLVECDEREIEVREHGRRVMKKIPQPTGNLVVMKDEAIRRIFTGDIVEDVLKKRIAMLDPEVWKMLGLDNAPEKLIAGEEKAPE